MRDYDKTAEEFCEKHGVEIRFKHLGNYPYFTDDDKPRDVYEVTIRRKDRPTLKPFVFKFGQSVANSRKQNCAGIAPTKYDVLASLTKYDVGDFEDFCADFGYDTDSNKALKLYLAVQKEYRNVQRIFHDCLEDIIEIN